MAKFLVVLGVLLTGCTAPLQPPVAKTELGTAWVAVYQEELQTYRNAMCKQSWQPYCQGDKARSVK